ncbi:MAG: aldo/keto reductase [Armatimonadia bacterium]
MGIAIQQTAKMEYRRLGESGEQVSAIILGAWQFGKANWTGVEDQESIATMQAALDAGINMIDTAAAYGDGYSEEIVGRAVSGRREEVLLASKCDGDPNRIREAIDKALKRLQTDHIDLYQIHYPLPKYPVTDAVGAMDELRQAGKIRWIGVSNFNLQQMQEAVRTARIETCQPPYNVFWRQFEDDVLPFCQENRISVLSYSSLAQGLLTGKFRKREDIPHDIRAHNKLFAEGIFEQCLQVVEMMDVMAQQYDRTHAQIAIAWALQAPAVTAPIVGARNRRQLEGNLGGVGFRLSDEDWQKLSEAGMRISNQLNFDTNMWGYAPS